MNYEWKFYMFRTPDYIYMTDEPPTISDKLNENGVDLKKPIQVNPFGEWLDCTIGIIKDDRIGVYVGGDHHWITAYRMIRNKKKEVTKTIANFLCEDGLVRIAIDDGIFKKEQYLREKGIGYEKIEMKKTWEVN